MVLFFLVLGLLFEPPTTRNSTWYSFQMDIQYILELASPEDQLLSLYFPHLHDSADEVSYSIKLVAVDTSRYVIVEQPSVAATFSHDDTSNISSRAEKLLVTCNSTKSESVLISGQRNQKQQAVLMFGQTKCEFHVQKQLYILLTHGRCHSIIGYTTDKAGKRINIMGKLKFLLARTSIVVSSYLMICIYSYT